MDSLLRLGRWIFPLSFLMYVALHFGKPATGADFVPDWLPFPYFWNYFTGLCVLAFVVSAVIGKYDKLATVLMALYVFLMIFLVHLPRAGESELEAVNAFRNVMVVGALLVYARHVARDPRGVGVRRIAGGETAVSSVES